MSVAPEWPIPVAAAHRPFRVLLVEGDPAVVAAVRWVLEEDGIEVVVHFSGAGVADRVREEGADLVLVDPRRAWLSDEELEQALQLSHGARPVPVVFLGDGTELELRALALRCRAFGHVSKGGIPRQRSRIRVVPILD